MGPNNATGLYDHPHEEYIRGNMTKAHIPTTTTMIDLKGPNCHTGKAVSQILQENPFDHTASLAATVAERCTQEEGLFVGHPQED